MDSTKTTDDVDRFRAEIDMYKFHLDIAIKAGIFVFGISGAISSYYFGNKSIDLANFSLVVSIILNLGFAIVYGLGVSAANEMERNHQHTCKSLNLEPFDMRPLAGVCQTMWIMCAMVAVGLSVVTIYYW